MTNLEHYFENLLYHGEDIEGEANKNALTEEQQKSVEQCAQYVIYSLFGTREHFDEWIKRDAASPWHRVEDELPYENTNALFYDEKGYFHVGSMSRFRGYTEFIDYDGNTLHGVTHWMPIEPPKED